MARKLTIAGTICLYGNHRAGWGWLASAFTGSTYEEREHLGNGDLNLCLSATETVWTAALAIQKAHGGDTSGLVEICMDTENGPVMVTARLAQIPYFGDLKFGPGRVYEASAEEIERAAER